MKVELVGGGGGGGEIEFSGSIEYIQFAMWGGMNNELPLKPAWKERFDHHTEIRMIFQKWTNL